MREPIKPSELRIGDKVRTEGRDGRPFGTHPQMLASEWIVSEDDLDGDFEGVDLYVLERRGPVLDLPTQETLGRLTWQNSSGSRVTVLATWAHRANLVVSDLGHAIWEDRVVGLEPVIVVPEPALDRLRIRGFFSTADTLRKNIDTFLAAVDAANGGPR